MGAVSIDIHKKEREFSLFTLSDENVVRYLILYRSKLDCSYNSSINYNIEQAGDTFDFNVELLSIFADLDKLVEKCNFNEKELYLIKLLNDGNTLNDVYNNLEDYARTTTKRMLDKIVKKISEEDKKRWKTTVCLKK